MLVKALGGIFTVIGLGGAVVAFGGHVSVFGPSKSAALAILALVVGWMGLMILILSDRILKIPIAKKLEPDQLESIDRIIAMVCIGLLLSWSGYMLLNWLTSGI